MAAGLDGKYYVFALRAFTDITATIVVPAIVVLFLKTFTRMSSAVFALLLVATFVATAVVLYRKIIRYGSAFQKLNDASGSSSGPRS